MITPRFRVEADYAELVRRVTYMLMEWLEIQNYPGQQHLKEIGLLAAKLVGTIDYYHERSDQRSETERSVNLERAFIGSEWNVRRPWCREYLG